MEGDWSREHASLLSVYSCVFGVGECRMLEGDEFVRRVVPSLSRLFASSDRNLRRNLLEAIDSFGPHLTQVGVRVGIQSKGKSISVCVCTRSIWSSR